MNIVLWLKRKPEPVKLRIKDADGEERIIEMQKHRRRFAAAESDLKTAGAVSVQALSKEDTILRSFELDADDDTDDEPDRTGKAISKERRELAGILDAQGRAIREAYREGAEAAGTSSDKLIAIVDTLTQHLTLAITNLHNVSANFANAIQAHARELPEGASESGNGEKLMALLGPLVMGAMQGQQAPPAPRPNGSPTPKGK